MKAHINFTLLCCLITGYAVGQKSSYLDLGVGLTNHIMQDKAMSPVQYTGVLPTLSFGLLKEKHGRKLIEWHFPLQYGTLQSKSAKEYPSMKGNMFRFDLDYIHLRQTKLIKDPTHGEFFVGGSLHTFLDFRLMPQLDNSAIIYDHFNSIAFSAAYRHAFKLRSKTLKHYHRISIPLLSYGTRPDYMNMFDIIAPKGNDFLADAFSRARFCSFGSFQRLIIKNTLFYPIRGNNQLAVTYEWQTFSASFTEKVKSASHAILFSLLINI
jgi:hypothetical protein